MVRRARGLVDDGGAGTLDYVGIVLAAAVLVGAMVVFVPSLAPTLTCALQRAMATATGGSAPECASAEASGSDDESSDGGADTQVPLSLSPISSDGTVPSGTSTHAMQLDAPDCDSWYAVSDKSWAKPHTPPSEPPQVAARGSGSGSMKVTFHANPGAAREATITIHCSDGRTISQKIVQPGGAQKYGGALGDSYSAAPGARAISVKTGIPRLDLMFNLGFNLTTGIFNVYDDEYATSLDGGNCARGSLGWPRLLGAGHGTSYGTPNLQMSREAFVACTGATTDGSNLVNDKKGFNHQSVNEQIKNSDLHDADIVTLSVGGNDIGFADVVLDCLGFNVISDCGKSLSDSNAVIENSLQEKLEGTYNELLKAAPNATIYIVGYPAAVEYDDADDPAGLDKIKKANRVQAAGLLENLNAKISDTVDKVNAAKVDAGEGPRLVFVDPAAPDSPFVGHSVTDADPYVHGVVLPQKSYSYHPNIRGNAAMADLVGEYMLGYR